MSAKIPLITQLPQNQQHEWIHYLSKSLPEENIVLANLINLSERTQCEIAIVADPEIKTLQTFSNLKWVHSLWAGVENLVDCAITQKFDILRLSDPQLSETMAEAVLAWCLYLHRKMPSYLDQQTEKIWRPRPYQLPQQCKVGILGLGQLGEASAQRLIANNFQVMGWSQSKKTIDDVACYFGQQGLKEMLKDCQILVCLLPLTDETKRIIDRKLLAQLPEQASIINFARGGLLVVEDLLQKFQQGHLYHAVLDVFDQEPLGGESQLWSHPHITVLPHIAASTNLRSAAKIVGKNILSYRKTGKTPSFVDLNRGY